VIVETTGIAHPSPIIVALRDSGCAARFELAAIVCTVDADTGLERVAQRPECLAQVVLADTLVITRCDLSTAARIGELEARLRTLNRHASLVRASDIGTGAAIALRRAGDRGAHETGDAKPPRAQATLDERGRTHPLGRSGRIRALGHVGIDVETIRFSGPSVWSGALARIESLAASLGDRLLRIKGVLRLDGYDTPMVVQWAGGRVSPLVALPGGLDDGDAGYLVIISERTDRR
jgi:G3E family GTPase